MGHPFQKLGSGERLIFNKEGSSATVTVREDAEGGRMLSINGHDEVPVDPSYLLFSLYLMSGDTIDRFVGNGPLNTDNKAYLEHSAARCFGRETIPENLLALKNSRENLIDYFNNRAGLKNIKTDGMLNELAAARESMIMGRTEMTIETR